MGKKKLFELKLLDITLYCINVDNLGTTQANSTDDLSRSFISVAGLNLKYLPLAKPLKLLTIRPQKNWLLMTQQLCVVKM